MTQVFFFISFFFSFSENVFFPCNYIGCHSFKVHSKEIFRRTFTFSITHYLLQKAAMRLTRSLPSERDLILESAHKTRLMQFTLAKQCVCGAKRPSSRWGLPRCLISSVVSNIFRLSHEEHSSAVVTNVVFSYARSCFSPF